MTALSSPSTTSLYDLLAEAAPQGTAAGETAITRQKETLDNDVEAFDLEFEPSSR
jgi:hypothetical protein